MRDAIFCAACGSPCDVDGEYPRFVAWCEKCNDYADWDIEEYTVDYISGKMDEAKDANKYKEEK